MAFQLNYIDDVHGTAYKECYVKIRRVEIDFKEVHSVDDNTVTSVVLYKLIVDYYSDKKARDVYKKPLHTIMYKESREKDTEENFSDYRTIGYTFLKSLDTFKDAIDV